MIALLSELVLMETPSTDAAAQQPILQRLAAEFAARGMHTITVPGRNSGGHLYAAPRPRVKRRPVQLLLGHCDTVWPTGTLETMPLKQESDRIHGPGIYDMKAGTRRNDIRARGNKGIFP